MLPNNNILMTILCYFAGACSSVQYYSLFTNLPSVCPAASYSGYSAGLGIVSMIMIASLTGNIVLVIGCVLMRRRHSFDLKK